METHGEKGAQLGLISIILLGINGIIGSGIFLLPNQVASLMGTAGIFSLIFDALLAISIAMCFAQAATYYDEDGGPYLYAKDAFGDFVGFEVGFVTWAIQIIAEATMAVAFATALGATFPALANIWAKNITVTVLLGLMALMNIAGVKVSKIVNNIVTLSKLIPLLLFVTMGIFFIHGGNFTPLFPHGHYTAGHFGAAAVTMFYAFAGFERVVVAAGDMKNPKKNLPRALLIMVGIVLAFYLLIQTVCTGVLGASALGHTTAPIQTAFAKFAGGFGNSLVAAGTLLSTGGFLVASSYVTPRSGVALAEHHMMPSMIAKRNSKHAPYVAILISIGISILIAWSGQFGYLAQISAVSRFAQYIPTCLAVLVFRRTRATAADRFQLPLGPVIPVVAVAVSIWLLFQVTALQAVLGLGALIVAIPFYFLMSRQAATAKDLS
ncbi:amino acid permease [Schleiferilactobacillus harbinensis]|jgi:amino acid transporter|uniref:APC family permease n=2 Tax=Schleiferilactobacillus harbinensis TaxID=304207 RepID=A0A510TZH1_9LACO|nr:APC family permease [Schleiferilactobacillus harbinensis]KRM24746.1 amino acid permease family protein [Schleiferilactobacillus harbinensis DSM 16991]MBO3091119.1 amino acid permease [Schleiferilactobacillus harbinensis]MCI1687247.1 APC family permease [Schleiferilactobacillus harbinensis]MCI1784375.1 APC family permease [Schleiferilactobacillus harbinensis]MCI1851225.1 APC family permease [Schleiferilactobacillus harbinensis]